MRRLSLTQDLVMGCDPEFFFTKDGKVIGAEFVLPKEGLDVTLYEHDPNPSKFIIDGVQAELNPRPDVCRGTLGNTIAICFGQLRTHLKKRKFKGVGTSFDVAVKVRKTEFNNLSDNCKRFGCSVSFNITPDGRKQRSVIAVNPFEYRYRAGGGHIHLGQEPHSRMRGLKERLQTPELMVPLLDIIVGNTCVMVDRDRGNKERRKTYGRAGEYRVPSHGLEYRTPSNFWLRAPELFSLVTGLARTAVQLGVESDAENDYIKEIHKRVKMEDIAEAINTNNPQLAKRNFKKIEDLLMDVLPEGGFYPINKGNIDKFYKFVEDGMDKYFTGDPVDVWADMMDAHAHGFNGFLVQKV